jgi:tellurite resistance protein
MTGYTDTQLNVWLRGLLAIAWADGDFTAAERATIIELTQTELPHGSDLSHLDPICTDELVASFGHCSQMAENFLRTAMMVALAGHLITQISPSSQCRYPSFDCLGKYDDKCEYLRVRCRKYPQK